MPLKSSHPGIVKETALFNLATCVADSIGLPDGHLMGWKVSWTVSVPATVHVPTWNYEWQHLSFKFG